MPNLPQDRKILDRIEALPEGTWQPCPGCAAMLHQQQLRLHQAICPGCGHHFRLGAWDRIASLVDTGTFAERFAELTPSDPLGFVDRMPYSQRLTRAQAATGLTEALI